MYGCRHLRSQEDGKVLKVYLQNDAEKSMTVSFGMPGAEQIAAAIYSISADQNTLTLEFADAVNADNPPAIHNAIILRGENTVGSTHIVNVTSDSPLRCIARW